MNLRMIRIQPFYWNTIMKKYALKIFYLLFFTVFVCTISAKDNSTSVSKRLSSILVYFPKEIVKKINNNRKQFLAELDDVILSSKKDNLLILIDKNHLLDKAYRPEDIIKLSGYKNRAYVLDRIDIELAKCAEAPLQEMAAAARKDGVKIVVSSGYRPYNYQSDLFNNYIKWYGEQKAKKFSAPPGASQHQLGTAIDFGTIDDAYSNTPAGKWLEKNAWKYGWSLSYPKDYEKITGYVWECWHYRYIGKKACAFQQKWFNGIQQYTLEFIHYWQTTE